MATTAVDPGEYYLGGSEFAFLRLGFQFELARRNLSNALFSPLSTIPSPLPANTLIADVATGPGTWAMDVAEENPQCVVEGLDINLSLAPARGKRSSSTTTGEGGWLPGNLSFHEFDLLGEEELPEKWRGRYDVVNLQFVMVFVRDHNFAGVLRRLMEMLKPGGHLQWTDADSGAFSFLTLDGSTPHPPEIEKLAAWSDSLFGSKVHPRTWVGKIDTELRNAGLEEVSLVRAKNRASTWPALLETYFVTCAEAGRGLARKLPHRKEEFEGYFAQRERAMAEARELGVGMDMAVVRACGRKPLC